MRFCVWIVLFAAAKFLASPAAPLAEGDSVGASIPRASSSLVDEESVPWSDLPPDVKNRVLISMPIRDVLRMQQVDKKWSEHLRDSGHLAFIIHRQFGDCAAEEAYRAGVCNLAAYKKILDLSGWTPNNAVFAMRGVGLSGNLDEIYEMRNRIISKIGVDLIQEAYIGIARSGNVTSFQSLKSNHQLPTLVTRHLMMQEAAANNRLDFIKFLVNSTRIADEGVMLAGIAAVRFKHWKIYEFLQSVSIEFRAAKQIVKHATRFLGDTDSITTYLRVLGNKYSGRRLQELYETMLKNAARVNNLIMIRYLLGGISFDRNELESALIEAARFGNLECVKFLSRANLPGGALNRAYIRANGQRREEIWEFLEPRVNLHSVVKTAVHAMHQDVDLLHRVLVTDGSLLLQYRRDLMPAAFDTKRADIIQALIEKRYLEGEALRNLFHDDAMRDLDLVVMLQNRQILYESLGSLWLESCNNMRIATDDICDIGIVLLLRSNIEYLTDHELMRDVQSRYPIAFFDGLRRALLTAEKHQLKSSIAHLRQFLPNHIY